LKLTRSGTDKPTGPCFEARSAPHSHVVAVPLSRLAGGLRTLPDVPGDRGKHVPWFMVRQQESRGQITLHWPAHTDTGASVGVAASCDTGRTDDNTGSVWSATSRRQSGCYQVCNPGQSHALHTSLGRDVQCSCRTFLPDVEGRVLPGDGAAHRNHAIGQMSMHTLAMGCQRALQVRVWSRGTACSRSSAHNLFSPLPFRHHGRDSRRVSAGPCGVAHAVFFGCRASPPRRT